MAKISKLPNLEIIDGFRGVIDFYIYLGIPCVRKWPKKAGPVRSPAVEATWPAFTYLAQQWQNVEQSVRDAYEEMASGTGLTAKDWYFRLYLTSDYWEIL